MHTRVRAWSRVVRIVLVEGAGCVLLIMPNDAVDLSTTDVPLVTQAFNREKPRMVSDLTKRSAWQSCAIVLLVTIGVVGCKSPQTCCDPGLPTRELACRTGVTMQKTPPCQQVIPPGVILEDSLSEDEAVLIALSNNSAFQATLAQLGMAHGDAVQANLLMNPQYLIYFPTGAKEGQYTLFAPIESYLLRPTRVKVANREYRRIGETLVQNGLDLARNVRVAYADLAVATQQAQLAQEALQIRDEVFDVTEKRLKDGDISELETINAKVDRLNAKAAAGVQDQTVAIAEARLATLIGLTRLPTPLVPLPLQSPALLTLDEQQLIDQAFACRPDYNAAKWAVAAASQRSRLSRWLFLRLDGVVDVRSDPGGRTGGGLRFDIPIFNRNEGGVIRADWEVNAAMHQRDTIADQIVADVRTSIRTLRQASENLQVLEQEVAPALVESLDISRKGFADGGTDYLLVLQTTTQYLDAKARILDQKAAYSRALAELERAVGCHLEAGLVDYETFMEVVDVPLAMPAEDPNEEADSDMSTDEGDEPANSEPEETAGEQGSKNLADLLELHGNR
ncbi:TolC family protein [Neorhodopirellula lusitana]|nr:TolC family protein [Neorhodopirellula lusitana]